jgi:methylase of polypeptide subunit release factors
VYAERPFAGPQQVLAYLSRYTHRVASSSGMVIDLGCGSGLWARRLADAGFGVLGMDFNIVPASAFAQPTLREKPTAFGGASVWAPPAVRR